MIDTEKRLERATATLEARRSHAVAERYRELALSRASGRGLDLSAEQRGALDHVTSARGISNVIGYAGTGKSAMLGVAREAWERSEEHTSELQSLMRISYAVFCLKKKKNKHHTHTVKTAYHNALQLGDDII